MSGKVEIWMKVPRSLGQPSPESAFEACLLRQAHSLWREYGMGRPVDRAAAKLRHRPITAARDIDFTSGLVAFEVPRGTEQHQKPVNAPIVLGGGCRWLVRGSASDQHLTPTRPRRVSHIEHRLVATQHRRARDPHDVGPETWRVNRRDHV
jgi:hypothetical protein